MSPAIRPSSPLNIQSATVTSSATYPPANSALIGPVDMFELLGAIAQPIYVKSSDHRWLYANEAAAKLIGLTSESLAGRNEADFLPQPLARELTAQDSDFFAAQSAAESNYSQHDQSSLIFGGDRRFTGRRKLIKIKGQTVLINTLQETTALASVQRQNHGLNKQLKTALLLESTLKRITDRVRDSLDEEEILRIALQELGEALKVRAANTALYDLEQGTSTVYHEYSADLAPMRGRVSQMEAYPEVYDQLLAGQYLQFCSIFPNPERGRVSMFAAPILDDQDVLGDLWLINDMDHGLSELDIRLVQQVTNQCAIAIRQARLYKESQSQVRELEHLNTLKDDFLSTVSHELRTPVTSMRVALQLLGVVLDEAHDLEAELAKPQLEQSKIARYYRILQEECEREISLINDLLDLQRLDVGNHPMNLQPIDLHSWLPNVISGFKPRASNRGQTISVKLPDDLPNLVSDLASIERVLTELINNACKYTPPNHSIHISVTHAPPQETLRFNVVNTGIEISEPERQRIFDKFYRVPSADPWKQGGTGLGLALVQKLVEHLEGHIEVESSHNQTAFIVELPIEATPR
ncbi:MAG: ATP-binding protein [Phormidesmis sp.]